MANSTILNGFYTYAGLPPANSVTPGTTLVTIDRGLVVTNGTTWTLTETTGTGISSDVGCYNIARSNTNKWRAARGKVATGGGNARVVCSGNSITGGYNATGSTSIANMKSKSYPTQLAQVLNARGLTASWQSFIGGQNYTTWNATDNRIVQGTWANSGLGTFGGNCLTLSAAGTLMSFTPTTTVDTVEVVAVRNSGTAAITIAVDGGGTLFTYNPGSGASPNQLGTSGAHTLGTLGTHAIQANVSVSTATFLVGMIAWNSAISEVQILNAGWHGSVVSDFNNTSWTYTDGLRAVAPDLTLIAMTRNDATNGTSLLSFKTLYQNVITAAKVSGDCFLVIEPLGSLDPVVAAPYVSAVYDLANLNNLPVLDFSLMWDAYANTSGWYGDGTHPNGFAYGEMARQIAEILVQI